MKKFLKVFLGVLLGCIAAISLVACGGGGDDAIDNNHKAPVTGDSKILVAYFSFSGNTQQLANMVAESTGGELFRIVPETAYGSDVFDRAQNELNNKTRPAITSHIDEEVMAEYDVIFVGYPVWWYDLPMPVWTFLEEYDLSGKTIIPFFSHNGSSSGASSRSTIATLCPDSTVLTNDYFSVRGRSVSGATQQVKEWVERLGYTASNEE